MTGRQRLAVIVPCHNETANVGPFFESASKTLDSLPLDWSIVFVNDASTDDTLDKILALRGRDARVKVATLSRNFGYHAALVAGLSNADADLYAIVDVDGEDPPEMLAQFHAGLAVGEDVAGGVEKRQVRRLVAHRLDHGGVVGGDGHAHRDPDELPERDAEPLARGQQLRRPLRRREDEVE